MSSAVLYVFLKVIQYCQLLCFRCSTVSYDRLAVWLLLLCVTNFHHDVDLLYSLLNKTSLLSLRGFSCLNIDLRGCDRLQSLQAKRFTSSQSSHVLLYI